LAEKPDVAGPGPSGLHRRDRNLHEHDAASRAFEATTFVAALRNDRITAPLVIDGAMNGKTFVRYVEQFLVPTLTSDDIVLMDNLPVHKVAGVKSAIRSAGASVL
jgi:hypothetical protein